MRLFIAILIVGSLYGCSTARIFRDEQGRVTRINSTGILDMKVKKDKETVEYKTKIDWWPKDLVNVVFGAKTN